MMPTVPTRPGFDYPGLPDDLVRRWLRNDPDRMVVVDLALFLVTAGSAVVGLVALVSLIAGDSPLASIALAIVAAVVTVLGVLVRKALERRGTLLPVEDIDRVLEHRTESDATGIRPDAADHPELLLVSAAYETADAISANPAWSAAEIDFHHLYLDPQSEARDIDLAVAGVVDVRDRIGARPIGDSPTVAQAQQEWDAISGRLDAGVAVLETRVAALQTYREELDGVAAHLAAVERLRHLTAVTEVGLGSLAVHEVVSEESTDVVRRLSDDLRQLTARPDENGQGS
jgi:hypothetical protein